jgi:MauM/NapG family ferredoxin protein
MHSTSWRRARQITQVVSFALFVLLALLTYRGAEFFLPLDLFFRLDPLAAFGAMVASRALLATLLLSAVMLALGFVFGRAWCGWLCPLGALLDWFSPRALRKIELHTNWRAAKYILLVVIVVAALLGNLSLLIFDPITLLTRTFGVVVIPALNVLIVGAETILYPLTPLSPALDAFESNVRGTFLPAQQTYYQLGSLFALLFALVVALNWIVPRFWCRYLCPLGAVYALEAKFAWLKPHAVAECDHCAQCVRVCPTGAITVSKKGFTVEPAECTLCLDCLAQCPLRALEFKPGRSGAARVEFDVTRRQALGGLALGVTAVALFRSAPAARRDAAFLIRPPGARENDLLSKCIRCGECVKVCPTGGLQPSFTEAGLEGFWTPNLISRLGYCDYSCNACGQICPTGAIPPLTIEAKRQRVIGVAYIDQNRCLPWSRYRPCVVCQEMCPIPDKAIKLEEVDVVAPDGNPVHLQRPRVVHDLCIGCGICEYQCPLNGPAAIRVYVPTDLPALG